MVKSKLAFTMSDSGNISVFVGGQCYSFNKDYLYYNDVKKAVVAGDVKKIKKFADVNKLVMKASFGKVQINNGKVFYNKQESHTYLAKKMIDFMREGLPVKPLMVFMNNMMKNPNPGSVEQLYKFLSERHMAITEDGCFIAYKGVREDYKDIHSGTILNKVGKVVKMDRAKVTYDPDQTCSAGLHVGSIDYVKGYASGPKNKILLIKVNPEHCVSVPNEAGAQKLRVCQYKVIGEYKETLYDLVYKVKYEMD